MENKVKVFMFCPCGGTFAGKYGLRRYWKRVHRSHLRPGDKFLVRLQPTKWYVTLYLDDRGYGGPEEGGWYYDCGDPVKSEHNREFTDEQAARVYLAEVREKVEAGMNDGRASKFSVLSSGVYHFHFESHRPGRYPKVRPHFE